MNKVLFAIRQLLQASVATDDSVLTGIKAIFYGDPVEIADVDLPCLIIQPIQTEYDHENSGSRYDRKRHDVEIRCVYSKKDYMRSTAGDIRKVYGVEDAITRIESVSTSGQTAATSVCGVIQRNHNLPYTDEHGNQFYAAIMAKVRTVNYVFSLTRGIATFEVIVTAEITVQGDR